MIIFPKEYAISSSWCSTTLAQFRKPKKSHTCGEGGGTPQNFFLAIIAELEKQIII